MVSPVIEVVDSSNKEATPAETPISFDLGAGTAVEPLATTEAPSPFPDTTPGSVPVGEKVIDASQVFAANAATIPDKPAGEPTTVFNLEPTTPSDPDSGMKLGSVTEVPATEEPAPEPEATVEAGVSNEANPEQKVAALREKTEAEITEEEQAIAQLENDLKAIQDKISQRQANLKQLRTLPFEQVEAAIDIRKKNEADLAAANKQISDALLAIESKISDAHRAGEKTDQSMAA
jgi:hypothetical protein